MQYNLRKISGKYFFVFLVFALLMKGGISVEESVSFTSSGDDQSNVQESLESLGLSPIRALKVMILNDALHKELRPNNKKRKIEVNLDDFSPIKVTKYIEIGGKFEELVKQIINLKETYSSPIRNSNFYPSGIVVSPAARQTMTRREVDLGFKSGVVKKLFVEALVRPIVEETPEEKKIRQEQQKQDFLLAEEKRGIAPNGLHEELKKEWEIWQGYLNYIKIRKGQLGVKEDVIEDDEEIEVEDENKGNERGDNLVKKIRKGEIEDAFYKFVAPHLTHYEIKDYDVYVSKETLDPNRLNLKKQTNREAMLLGNCPIGADGKSMNYHHLTHYDRLTHNKLSIIVLITYTLHTEYSGLLHFGRNTFLDLPQEKLSRPLFNEVRQKEFNPLIAKTPF